MAYAQKVVGGICPDCGAKYILNPKTNKIFCENKCWLDPSKQVKKQDPNWAKNVPESIKKPEPVKAPNWDRIREEKSEDIRASVAINKTADLICAGKVVLSDFELVADRLYNYKPTRSGQIYEAKKDEDGFPTDQIPF